MTWQEGYLRQAMGDYDIYAEMNERNDPLCHRLHYLQMASEKLAKSFLCIGNEKPSKKTHYALVRFLKITKRLPKIQRLLNYNENYLGYCAYIDSLLDIAEQIEKLAPVGGDHDRMNAEYPWKDAAGEIQVPRDYVFDEFEQTDLIKIQVLLMNLFRIAPKV